MSIGTHIYDGLTMVRRKFVPPDQRLDPKAKVAFTIQVGQKREHKVNRLDPLRAFKLRPKGSKMPPMYKIISHKRKDGSICEQRILL